MEILLFVFHCRWSKWKKNAVIKHTVIYNMLGGSNVTSLYRPLKLVNFREHMVILYLDTWL